MKSLFKYIKKMKMKITPKMISTIYKIHFKNKKALEDALIMLLL